MMTCAAKSADPRHYAAAVAAAVHGTPMHSWRRGLEGDLDRSFNVKRKLNPESPIVVDDTSHRLDKDVRTVRNAIVMNLPPRYQIRASGSRNLRSPSTRTWTPRKSNHGSTHRTFNTGGGVGASPATPASGNIDCGSPSVATLFATPRMSPALSPARFPTIELSEESDDLALSLEPTWSHPTTGAASTSKVYCYFATFQYRRPIVELSNEPLNGQRHLRRTLMRSQITCSSTAFRVGLARCGKLVALVKRRTVVVPYFLGKRGSHFGGQPFQFTFCPNSSAGCIQNVVYGLAGSKPNIPKVWPIAPSTQLNQEEADALRAAGFVVM
jgi:hypothetical protein